MRDDTNTTDIEVAVAYLDAIRLARAGAADDKTFNHVIDELLAAAPMTEFPKTDTLSVRFLVDAIQECGGKFTTP